MLGSGWDEADTKQRRTRELAESKQGKLHIKPFHAAYPDKKDLMDLTPEEQTSYTEGLDIVKKVSAHN